MQRVIRVILSIDRRVYMCVCVYCRVSIVTAMSASALRDDSGDEEGDNDGDSSDSGSQPAAQERVPRELLHWRQAVGSASSASQLWVCLSQLESCIAWEKSVMRVVSWAH